ncbi:related to Cell cycle control protein cwf25 [Melanopsichium pennsylvanicum]|uniref:Related to Cell cycle control protein cwf25 n=2 Tax=Melanopsichium pennsylvanicum TaxID=63383 RepID=A0AAJ4XS96_9BASI|nr:related to Cell cycle control protein cwf25 [Melanopsichium pennsylvanicum]
MGGGDLNMKKSWHPLLHVNQERVWKREKEALEERKKVEQLRREREQEREMQELQRLQEEAGGKKRVDKVDWMYATPATTGSNSAEEMEDYLLGKKRVDKLLQGDQNKEVPESSQKSLISLQNANSARDLAAKVREDPMLAIKQQEQAAYEALLRDPARLRQLKMQAGIDIDAEFKEERRKRSRRHRDEEHRSSRRHRDNERQDNDRRHGSGHERDSRRRDCERLRSSAANPDHEERRSIARRSGQRWDRSVNDNRTRSPSANRSRSPVRDRGLVRVRDSYTPSHRDPTHTNRRNAVHASFHNREEEDKRKEEIRQQKLRDMEENAISLEQQRSAYVSKINAKEAEQERKEAELRRKLLDARARGYGDGKGGFILDQQRKTLGDGVDLAERMRRGRGRLQRMD